ncbi:MAG: hypothetical protein KAJ06_00830 [Gammaproteobacteria bacterium]|nr:hypothetical protein [Gammaproteobacteria bacterium]
MLATLTFDLGDPIDAEKFEVARKADKWFLAAWELNQYLFNKKEHERFWPPAHIKLMESILEKQIECMESHGLSFEDLS